MRKVLVAGCSYSAGWRLPGEKHCPDLWCNQLFPDHDVSNIAWHGANNEGIFHEVCKNIRLVHYDQILVAWTAIPRYTFNFGLELYDTTTKFTDEPLHLVGNEYIAGAYLEDIGNRIRRYHNDHWDILKIVQYVNIILELARYHKQGSVWFVNALLPWCKNYFSKISFQQPSELDPFLQNMLQIELRDDSEIRNLYEKIHKDYALHGSINQPNWLNLYASLDNLKVDTISSNDSHPGLNSQGVYAKKLREQLCGKQN